eukprot:480668-Amphidinium_carterae.1
MSVLICGNGQQLALSDVWVTKGPRVAVWTPHEKSRSGLQQPRFWETPILSPNFKFTENPYKK